MSALGGCALIVGDPTGDYVPPTGSSSKEGGAKDATANADRAAEGSTREDSSTRHDGGSGDSIADTAVEAAHDAGSSHDAGVSHEAGTSVDAHEAGASEAGQLHEAGIKDAHEASVAVDAGGYCANYLVPPGMSFFCDDFDEVSSVSAFGFTTFAGADASVIVQSAQFISPPNALLVGANSSNMQGEADVNRALSAQSKLTLEFDLKVVNFYVDGPYTQFASVTFASGASLSLGFLPTDSGTVTSAYVIEHDSNAGPNVNVGHATAAYDLSGWTHVSISMHSVGSGAQDTVTIGGSVIDAAHGLGVGYFQGAPTISVGWTYLDGPGRREAYVDNVVVLTQ